MPYITTDPSDFKGRHAGLAGHVYTIAIITSAIMSRFPPIDPALTPKNPEPLTGDPYRDIGRRCARFVELWDHVDESDQFANSWGYTIFRTDYSSEERFAKAVKLLTTYPDHWLFEDLSLGKHWRLFNLTPRDPRVVYEVRSRLLNVVMDDRTTLDDATTEVVGQQFDLWSARIRDEAEVEGRTTARFMQCIMLDKESIDNLLTLPEQPSEVQAPVIYYVWVKVITNEVRIGRRRWLSMGVYDVLWENWLRVADQDIIYDKMVAVYDKEGVCNLYGPPTPFPGTTPLPPDYVYSPPRDERPGYPARTLCDIPYERLKP